MKNQIIESKEGKVEILSVAKSPAGSGHYKIKVAYLINGVKESDFFTTTDMQAIDSWDEETENFPETGGNHILECHFR